jgi:hypothetical protein
MIIIFYSVWFLSKVIKVIFSKKNQTETGSNQPVSVRFGYFRTKTGSDLV